MRPSQRAAILLVASSFFTLSAGRPARAQDKPPVDAMRWSDVAEFSYVATAGNAETTTLGFKNTLGRKWERSAFELKAGGVRAETTKKTRTAFGPDQTTFRVSEVKSTELNAESYYLNGRYDRKLSERFFWFGGGGWSRDRFAGVQNRYDVAGGLGNIWADTDHLKFRTDYALSYTKEDDVDAAPNFNDTFAGFRFSSKFERKFGETTTFGNDLVVDENLNDTSDLRVNMVNSVAVSMSRRLALKVSLQWLYDHQPAFGRIDLIDDTAIPPIKIGTVLDEHDSLDTIFTASLVVNF